MIRYTEFDHTADIGVEIYGDTLEELFVNAGYALFDTIVDASTVTSQIERPMRITGIDVEMLLINWLRELLYMFSVYQEVYADFQIHALQPTCLEATVKGEPLNAKKHRFHTELKAVTYHQLSVVQEEGHWKARVLFDV